MSDLPDGLLDDLLTLAVDVAASAAALLIDRLEREHVVDTKSTPTDMVTETDRASEALIVDAIRRARPDDAIVGEEGANQPGSSAVRWVVDPIDGTTNYLYALPGFSVSIAAEIAGDAAVGVVHDPLHRDVFTAVRGRGAQRNGRPIHVTGKDELATALLATGFAYDPDRRRAQAAVLQHVLPRIRDIRRFGSAAVDLCSVACGRVDGYYEVGLAPWDHAAGALIAREAGAVVSDLAGGPPSAEFAVAAGPHLHAPLRALLLEAEGTS